jgi:hypothetical protein
MTSAPRISVQLGAMLALAACGTTASPAISLEASATGEGASQAAAPVAVICEPARRPFDPNDIYLTGAWAGDDGGIYYFRQLGSGVVWWNGMSGLDGSPSDLGREWNNVGRGVINGLEIEVESADVPRGEILLHGTLKLDILDDGTGNIQITGVSEARGFDRIVWTPCTPVEE